MEPILIDLKFRVILLGDSTVGKSCLIKYLTESSFSESSAYTCGVDFYNHEIQVNDGTVVKLQVWDTAGQERFRSITESYYRDSKGVFLVYDITNHESFENIPMWMLKVKERIDIESHNPVFALIGCKLDLDKDKREVSQEEARALVEQHQMHFVETSSKTGLNVRETFVAATQEIYNRIHLGEYEIGEEGFLRQNSIKFSLVEGTAVKPCFC